jgi:hypothetical protein
MADDLLAATLNEWREIGQAATKGPWRAEPNTAAGRVWVQLERHRDRADREPLFNFRSLREPVDEAERNRQFAQREADAVFIATARNAMPLLLSALDEVLKLHARQDKPVRDYGAEGACPNHRVTALGRMNFKSLHDCPDCQYTEHYVCSHCSCPNDEWSCPTVRAITAELTKGEATP